MLFKEKTMTLRPSRTQSTGRITREDLVTLLNEDLAREYQAIISYVVYSQAITGAQYMNIASELEIHAAEELSHALILAGQIDYLGGTAVTAPLSVRMSSKAVDMLRFDLEAEAETIFHYRERVVQCEELGEYAIAEHIRGILVQEQDHLIALANALGVPVPDAAQSMTTFTEQAQICAGVEPVPITE
jgi:bacterioferritin